MKYNYPDKNGFFESYGGRFVPDVLDKELVVLEREYLQLRNKKRFQNELKHLFQDYVGRPSPLYYAQSLSDQKKNIRVYLKREDLNHTGAHKINNTLGQALLAREMGKKKLIAETGAGQHGVATATVAAKFGMECTVYMGARDIQNQKPNVYRMKLLGAEVVEVTQGQGTLKDAVDLALQAYVTDPTAYYLLGSAVGPHPYPQMVRDFQRVIGQEAKEQILSEEGTLPDKVMACIGGGSNAIGLFYSFIEDKGVELVGVEPAGKGSKTQKHGLALMKGKKGVIHGFQTLVLQDKDGAIGRSYSAASGLDYPGVGPELALLKDLGRLSTVGVTDEAAISAFEFLSSREGIIPALESAHAIAGCQQLLQNKQLKDHIIIINLSGRGDKDVETIYESFLAGRI